MNLSVFVPVLFLPCCLCFEPISSTVGLVGGLVVSVSFAVWETTKCLRSECCSKEWVNLNYTGFQNSLKKSLHGQHLVELIVARSIRGHILNKNPKKALVMSFNGWAGTGKNFVSKLIAESLYKKGLKSQYVHLYSGTQHFPHVSRLQDYKDQLQKEIKQYTELCPTSLFIFDEIDKMPEGLIDIIKPYIDYYEEVDGVDYRRNIFIFLSNAGGKAITKVSFDFWLDVKPRESITMKDIEEKIGRSSFNEKGGLKHSDIIEKNLIDAYVPFLPLEKMHVKLCVRDELLARGVYPNEKIISDVAGELIYYPDELKLYSQSGCKRITQKIDTHIEV